MNNKTIMHRIEREDIIKIYVARDHKVIRFMSNRNVHQTIFLLSFPLNYMIKLYEQTMPTCMFNEDTNVFVLKLESLKQCMISFSFSLPSKPL